jgi:predicted nucleotidyltransferase
MSELSAPIKDVVLELEKELKEFYGDQFCGLLLYGSYARGTAWEGSDVDLLLLLKGPINPSQEIMSSSPITASLSLESDLLLSVIPVDFESYQQGQTMFLRNVRKDAIPVVA